LISFDPRKKILTFDRRYSGKYGDTLHKRDIYASSENGKIKLRLILDKYSKESPARPGFLCFVIIF